MRRIFTRRELIVVLLLCAGLAGAAMRWFSEAGAIVHDVGTLLMVMWIPAVGNIIGYLMKRARSSGGATPAFEAGAPFVAHVRVRLTLDRAPGGAGNERRLMLLIGSEVFSARCLSNGDETLTAGTACTLDLQFLVPAVALPRLERARTFRVLEGSSVIGNGRVLEQ